MFGIGCWAGEECCYWFRTELEFELGLGWLGLLTGGFVFGCSMLRILDLSTSVVSYICDKGREVGGTLVLLGLFNCTLLLDYNVHGLFELLNSCV